MDTNKTGNIASKEWKDIARQVAFIGTDLNDLILPSS
jgi:hypothetical protein